MEVACHSIGRFCASGSVGVHTAVQSVPRQSVEDVGDDWCCGGVHPDVTSSGSGDCWGGIADDELTC
ncbi:MAG: hypothetical protein ACO23K_03330, partial [Ilumatobacteraceae bacterium]